MHVDPARAYQGQDEENPRRIENVKINAAEERAGHGVAWGHGLAVFKVSHVDDSPDGDDSGGTVASKDGFRQQD